MKTAYIKRACTIMDSGSKAYTKIASIKTYYMKRSYMRKAYTKPPFVITDYTR